MSLRLLLILASAAALSGCTSKSREDSTIPWNRPAAWEGQAPAGMGGFGPPGGGY